MEGCTQTSGLVIRHRLATLVTVGRLESLVQLLKGFLVWSASLFSLCWTALHTGLIVHTV